MAAEKILEIWAKRNPEWETKYEDTIIKVFCNYGKGTTSYQETRAKKFGAGYEIFIIAFFIGLYFIFFSFINSLMSTFNKVAIFTSISSGGWVVFEHHFEIVEGSFPNCSASHLPVFLCSTSTTFNRLIFFILIQLH